ncbi:hypothetical protein OOZ51_15510 [Arthrobacter sp. MI7-26]|nr:hypothetical protein [Arthrobacter sp. MI7-26]
MALLGGGSRGPLNGVLSGSYRLRVSARGLDQGQAGEFSEGPVDFYLLELWPAHPQPDAILRTWSVDGRYRHNEVGQRR